MRTITQMAAEVGDTVAKTKCHELIFKIESKLALIEHAIVENSGQLGESAFIGISFLISEIQKDLTRTGYCCERVEGYFDFLNNPELLDRINQAEKESAERRITQT